MRVFRYEGEPGQHYVAIQRHERLEHEEDGFKYSHLEVAAKVTDEGTILDTFGFAGYSKKDSDERWAHEGNDFYVDMSKEAREESEAILKGQVFDVSLDAATHAYNSGANLTFLGDHSVCTVIGVDPAPRGDDNYFVDDARSAAAAFDAVMWGIDEGRPTTQVISSLQAAPYGSHELPQS